MFRFNMTIVPPPRKKTWLEKRTNLEKQFLVILGICFLILTFLVTLMFSMYMKYGFVLKFIRPLATVLQEVNKLDKDALLSKLQTENVCMSANCVTIASQFLEAMNTSVDPCDDFYDFACQNWISKHTIPGDRGSISNFDRLSQDLSEEIKRIIENDLPKLTNNLAYRNFHEFWEVCKNETRQELMKDNELKAFIEDKLGGWPMASSEQEEDSKPFDLIDFHRKLDEQGYSTDGLIHISTILDVFNTSRYTILVAPPSAGLHHSYLLRNSTDIHVRHYFDLIKGAIQAYSPDLEVDDNEIWKLIDFEKRLVSLAKQDEIQSHLAPRMHKGKIKDLFLFSPDFPWSQFLELTFDRQIPESQAILYTETKYLTEFNQFINSAEKSQLRNYLVWRVVRRSMSIMDERWYGIIQKFYKQNYGFSVIAKNRTQFCYHLAYPTFYHLIDHLYVVAKPQLNEKVQHVTRLAESVHRQLLKSLHEAEWFDEETHARAIKKAMSVSLQVGYPKELKDAKRVTDYYSKLRIESNSSLYRNMLLINRWSKGMNGELLNTPNAKNDWKLFGQVLTVNAFFSRYRNAVTLPLGILSRHIFSEQHPAYMNFASLGFIVGHELTHGFDDEGSRADEHGQHDWWERGARQAFQKKVDCVASSYSNFAVHEDKRIRGKETVNENLADIGGIKLAFKAYRNHLRRRGLKGEHRLPGLQQFNHEQMFWISYANTWCRKSRTKSLIVNADLDKHSMAKYRVIGVLSNSAEFANSFKCAAGTTRMNPKQPKCTIW